MLHVNDLVFRIGGRTLFDGATLHVAAGQRVGLVGRNGSGKTTLFRLIAGEHQADGGTVSVRARARLGRVAQEAPGGETSLLDWVLAADEERAALLAEAETAREPQRVAEIHERLAAIGAHAAPARAGAILSGLGFDAAAQARPLGSYSGGWRMRVALAAALFARPDLLLLDEPTNHLDLEATLWLQDYLARWPGTLVLISHDRDLLNAVPQRIVHVEGGRLVAYAGNYDRFERTRRERLDLQTKEIAKRQEERRRIQAFVDRFRAKATKARQAQSRIKMLERLEVPVPVVEERSIRLDFPDPGPLPPPLIALDDVALGYDDGPPVLRGLGQRIDMDDRIALLGANGNGKSTFAKMLVGRLKPVAGHVHTAAGLRVGYFAQHQTDELDPARTPYDHMAALMPQAPEARVRAHLGRFGFEQQRADVTVGDLSGGEKARLLFALMTRDAPHLLVLDEPSNHLDIDAREALVQALNAYSGAVVLVSHDPHLVSLVADRLWLVADGTVRAFDGDIDDYRRRLLEQAREARREERGQGREAAGNNRRDERRAAAARRAEQAPLRRKVKEIERRLEDLHRRRERVAAALADPALYDGPAERITALQVEAGDIDKAVAAAEDDWLAAQEDLEESA